MENASLEINIRQGCRHYLSLPHSGPEEKSKEYLLFPARSSKGCLQLLDRIGSTTFSVGFEVEEAPHPRAGGDGEGDTLAQVSGGAFSSGEQGDAHWTCSRALRAEHHAVDCESVLVAGPSRR
jgi:hypothetical protein